MIICAALRYSDGTIIIGPRHFDHVMQRAANLQAMFNAHGRPEQGFIDQNGDFMDRHNAWIEAEKHGQVRHRVGGDGPTRAGLFSENLY